MKYNLDRYPDNLPSNISEQFITVPSSRLDGNSVSKYVGNKNDVTIPGYMAGFDINEIKTGTFQDSSVRTVTMLRGIRNIEEGAFDSCLSLVAVSVPDTVKELNINAFQNCPNLKFIDLESDKAKIDVEEFKEHYPNIEIIQGGRLISDPLPFDPNKIPANAACYSKETSSLYVGENVSQISVPQMTALVRRGGGDPCSQDLTLVFLGEQTMISEGQTFSQEMPFADIKSISRDELVGSEKANPEQDGPNQGDIR